MGFTMDDGTERRKRLETELPRIVEALKEKGARKIILFGSLARGDVGPISDLDLIVVLETEMSFTQRPAYLYDTLDQKVALDLLPYTQVELDELRESRPFIGQALREGRVLYEA